MKTRINKTYTNEYQMECIKEKLADFKNIFTENDLRRIFEEETQKDCTGEILKCEVEAFAINDYCTDRATFRVEMIIDNLIDFKRISFYMNEVRGMYSIESDELLLNYTKFR